MASSPRSRRWPEARHRPGLLLEGTALRRPALPLLALLLALAVPVVRAADPQPYHVEFGSVGNGELDATLRASSQLATLEGAAPVSPYGLIARARTDLDRLRVVLESYGYYQGSVRITLDGEDVTDITQGDRLAALPAGTVAKAMVSLTLGPLYHLRNIEIDGEIPAAAQKTLGLTAGQPATASDVLAGGARLLTALQNQGYAFAKVDTPAAFELPDTQQLDVKFHVVAGNIAHIGQIEFKGLQRMRLHRARGVLGLKSGELYSAAKVEQARRNLLDTGVFGTVDATLGTQADAEGRVPVTFTVSERKRHAVSLNAAYSSDLGGSAGVTWGDRNFLGGGEQLNLHASVININGSATNGLGYDVGAQLTLPRFLQKAQALQLSLTAIDQSLQAYDQVAETAAATLTRKLSSQWSASIGVSVTEEYIHQPEAATDPDLPPNDGRFHYTLIALPLGLSYDSTDLATPMADPTHGVRMGGSIAPTKSFGPPSAQFVISQFHISTYLDLDRFLGEQAGRTVLALRGLTGFAKGASDLDLPPDQRFYAGGSGTIRGFRFQSVGPTFSDGTPVGGISMDAVSAELRQRFGTNYGAAVFLDGGRVGDTSHPFAGQLKLGTGAGFRYYTPIGPLRVDFALPVHRESGDDRFEIYIGLGQAF